MELLACGLNRNICLLFEIKSGGMLIIVIASILLIVIAQLFQGTINMVVGPSPGLSTRHKRIVPVLHITLHTHASSHVHLPTCTFSNADAHNTHAHMHVYY